MSGFLAAPLVAFIKACKKDELSGVADHFGIVAGKLRKDELRNLVLSALVDQGVLPQSEKEVCEAQLGPSLESLAAAPHSPGWTFEQQKELLALQFEQDKLRRQEMFDLEKMRQNTERMKLDLEHSRLQLIREGRLSSCVSSRTASDTGSGSADIAACLRLVPRFNEWDPDMFFTL